MKRRIPWLASASVALLIASAAAGGLGLGDSTGTGYLGTFTYHNDISRSGQNLNETVLTPANVRARSFGKLWTDAVDGEIYGEPLYVPGVNIPGQGVHDVVYVVTENDSVYAFDADAAGPPLWKTSFINPPSVVPIPFSDVSAGCTDLTPTLGITSTPVIDSNAGLIYVVAATKEDADGSVPIYVQRLHALDLTTGLDRIPPAAIKPSVAGTGTGSSGGTLTFNPLLQNQRSALLLNNGIVYAGFGSHCDTEPYHGWLLGYDAANLAQVYAFNVTPDGDGGGTWMAGDGAAADSSGNVYVATGNGTFDADEGGDDYGDSVLKLGAGGGALGVLDFFTPYNQATLSSEDLDLGSGGILLLPHQTAQAPQLAIIAGKQGVIYLLDRDNLGGFSSLKDNIIQEINGQLAPIYSMPAYWNGYVYFIGDGDVPKQFQLISTTGRNGNVTVQLSSTPVSKGSVEFLFPGATPVISANGNSNAILWAIRNGAQDDSGNAVLEAFDATGVSNELYGSDQQRSRDAAGPYVKFTVPTVANGRVYVGTQTQLSVFGLLVAPTPTGTASATSTPASTSTPTATATVAATLTATPSPTRTSTPTPTVTPTPSPTSTPSATPTPTVAATATATGTATHTPTPTGTPTPIATPVATPSPTATAVATPTSPPTRTPTPTPSATATPTPSQTPTPVPSPTPTRTPTATSTPTPTATPTLAPTSTPTPTGSPTATPTSAPTGTETSTPTPTLAATPAPTASPTPSPTQSATPTTQATPTSSPTPTATPTASPTATPTPSVDGPLIVHPVKLKFRRRRVGAVSGPKFVHLKNPRRNKSALTISGFAVATGQFMIDRAKTNCGPMLAAGKSCRIGIRFAPDASGPASDMLTIDDNATNAPQAVNLSGAGK